MPDLMYSFFRTTNQPRSFLYSIAGTYSLFLTEGKYRFVLRGAGGAGGANGGNGVSGGCGGKGELVVYNDIVVSAPTQITLIVGEKGYLSGGNGGSGGSAGGYVGGQGGGGGHPSYFYLPTNSTYYYAEGGGGGGGGGGARFGGSKYSPVAASGGGGGGGKYWFSNGSVLSVNGAPGGDSATHSAQTGGNGDTSRFPNLYGGHGGWSADSAGVNAQGAAGGSGGGAGGGAGMCYISSHDYKSGGQGGGGAGGDNDAGGGTTQAGGQQNSSNPSNVKTIPTNIVAENAIYGVSGSFGMGGTPNNNGNDGFILIERLV